MSKEEIAATVNAITDLMTVLHNADPADKADVYAGLGLRLTYNPGPKTVIARAEPGRTCTKGLCPRGDLNPGPGEFSPDRGKSCA
jgi:site-specific DNA recombinase